MTNDDDDNDCLRITNDDDDNDCLRMTNDDDFKTPNFLLLHFFNPTP